MTFQPLRINAAQAVPRHWPGAMQSLSDEALVGCIAAHNDDALRVLGSDPIRKLVAPRIAAGVIMVPILTVISNALGILGAGLLSVFSLKLQWAFYWRSVTGALGINDLTMGLTKPIVFGFILSSVGCYMGLRTRGGTQGVGTATTRSVVVGTGVTVPVGVSAA